MTYQDPRLAKRTQTQATDSGHISRQLHVQHTNFEPKSRLAILPSGETLLLVSPGTSIVVARLCALAGFPTPAERIGDGETYILGELGAVASGVSVKE
jgi:hypothetical protein